MLQRPVATCRASAATGMALWHALVTDLRRAIASLSAARTNIRGCDRRVTAIAARRRVCSIATGVLHFTNVWRVIGVE